MFWGLIFALILGVVWVNLIVYYVFKSGFVYNYITRKGIMRDKFEEGSRRWLFALAGFICVYLVISDLIVLGYNDFRLPVVLLLNVFLVAVLLTYNAFVINRWLIAILRPMVLDISKLLTQVTIRSYTRYTLFRGGAGGFVLSLVSGWIYLLIVGLAE